MECKFDSSGFIPEGKGELIETLWNVNRKLTEEELQETVELIETLWNVNTAIVITTITKMRRINRNIVECKFVWKERKHRQSV